MKSITGRPKLFALREPDCFRVSLEGGIKGKTCSNEVEEGQLDILRLSRRLLPSGPPWGLGGRLKGLLPVGCLFQMFQDLL
jgi:hypothetical protein